MVVDSSGDENNPGDDVVTLREALAQANAFPGQDTIILSDQISGESIVTNIGFSISDDVTISGASAPDTKIVMTETGPLFSVSEGVVVNLESLTLDDDVITANASATAVLACGNVTLHQVTLRDFFKGLAFCGGNVDLTVDDSVMEDIVYPFLERRRFALGSLDVLVVDSSITGDSSTIVGTRDAVTNVEFRRTRFSAGSGSRVAVRVEGDVDFALVDSAVFDVPHFYFVAEYDRVNKGSVLEPDWVNYRPNIEIIQSTISGNSSSEEMMVFWDADVRIAHSTIVENTWRPVSPSHAPDPVILFRAGVEGGDNIVIDHSIVANNDYQTNGLEVRGVDLTATYSIIPSVAKSTGSEQVNTDSFTALYQDADVPLEPLVQSDTYVPYHLPSDGSFVVDAGNVSAAAGVSGVPAVEQRQSPRILGGVIDIGATERNRVPGLDHEALLAAYEEQVRLLQEQETPDEDVVLDLDNFATDPDGHAIVEIEFAGGPDLSFDATTHVLSGVAEAFKAAAMQVAIEDETGLVGTATVDWRARPKSSSGGGSFPLAFIALLLAGWLRRTRR